MTSRRKFIKSSGAIAGITVIPSKSVWGACNASGVSGGSQTVGDTCSAAEYQPESSGSTGRNKDEHVSYCKDSEKDKGKKNIVKSCSKDRWVDESYNKDYPETGEEKRCHYDDGSDTPKECIDKGGIVTDYGRGASHFDSAIRKCLELKNSKLFYNGTKICEDGELVSDRWGKSILESVFRLTKRRDRTLSNLLTKISSFASSSYTVDLSECSLDDTERRGRTRPGIRSALEDAVTASEAKSKYWFDDETEILYRKLNTFCGDQSLKYVTGTDSSGKATTATINIKDVLDGGFDQTIEDVCSLFINLHLGYLQQPTDWPFNGSNIEYCQHLIGVAVYSVANASTISSSVGNSCTSPGKLSVDTVYSKCGTPGF